MLSLDISLNVLFQTVLRKHIHPLFCQCSVLAQNVADIFSAELSRRITRIPSKPRKRSPKKACPFLQPNFFLFMSDLRHLAVDVAISLHAYL